MFSYSCIHGTNSTVESDLSPLATVQVLPERKGLFIHSPYLFPPCNNVREGVEFRMQFSGRNAILSKTQAGKIDGTYERPSSP